jgi:hypothetical protein
MRILDPKKDEIKKQKATKIETMVPASDMPLPSDWCSKVLNSSDAHDVQPATVVINHRLLMMRWGVCLQPLQHCTQAQAGTGCNGHRHRHRQAQAGVCGARAAEGSGGFISSCVSAVSYSNAYRNSQLSYLMVYQLSSLISYLSSLISYLLSLLHLQAGLAPQSTVSYWHPSTAVTAC